MIRFWPIVTVSLIFLTAVSIIALAEFRPVPATAEIDPPLDKWFADNFTQDSHLRQNIWQENSPVGRAVAGLWQAQDGGYPVSIIDPTLGFSSGGMEVSGVTGTFRISTIDSRASFTPPFKLQSTVMATEANGNPFALWIASKTGQEGLGLTGNLNPENGGYYGVWESYPENGVWNALGTMLYPSPSINTVYNLTISIDRTGNGTISIGSNGQVLASSTRQTGIGPFYVMLVQFEGWPYTIGANQAYWKSTSVSPTQTTTGTGSAGQATPPKVFLLQPFASGLCVSINGAMNPETAGAILGPATWSWGDGTTASSWFPATHTYTNTGPYDVTVTATDSNGLTGSASTIVNVTGSTTSTPPQLTISPATVSGQTVTVNGLANSNACGPPLQPFQFNWGDEKTTTGWFPQTHTYTQQGTFQLCVTATDSLGNSTTQCETVTI